MTRSFLPTLVSALLFLVAVAFLGWLVLFDWDYARSLWRIVCFAVVAVLFLRVREKDIAAHGPSPAALVDLAALVVLAVALRFYLCCAGAIVGHYVRAELLPRPDRARA